VVLAVILHLATLQPKAVVVAELPITAKDNRAVAVAAQRMLRVLLFREAQAHNQANQQQLMVLHWAETDLDFQAEQAKILQVMLVEAAAQAAQAQHTVKIL
jgi:hypothetical protein